ncbi:dynein axonemal intermediate chain 3 isoform X2 [Diorhabda carinulata]|uniref:dynein axonemal intermediate chain 3 isoform X2 n=1 Tax=Diorhabda carinulata TaxID=1163345 RepID=UPI0025A0472E|nr:dynein axonemal intermediate chain 3 isoform X2 [Diorhabda carinulata]
MFVGKEPIADNLELHEESSEFLPVKKEILAFPGNKILMGYIPDESKDTDEFYICITEAATKAVKDIIEKMKQQQEKRLYNTLNKTIRDWVPMGSEEEVDENLLKNNRPLIEVEIESQYPIFSSKPEFQIVKAENRRDGYVELKWTSEERIINVYKKRIDQPVQAAPRFITMEVQTTCTYPSNSATQYSYEVEDTTNILEKYAKSIKNYVEDNMDSLSDLLRVNSTINFYTDDYLELINTSASFLTGTTVEEVKEYMSFMDVNRCKDKMIADVVWHPMWSGTVALAYTDEAPFIYHYGPNTEDNVLKAVHGNNLTLIWSCLDGLRPKLILESPREVTKLAFCKFDENILIGGLKNGQIIIWDIRNKLQKVEELEVLTTAQQKYRAYMNSLMTWMKNIHDLAIIRPTAISDLRRSHKGPVTGDFIQMVWEGQDFDSGEIVNSESGVIVSRGRYHDGPINSIEISPAHDIILTVGGRVFALWTPEYQHRPLLWRKRKYLYTSGEWNIHEPHLFTIKVVNGDVECWSLAYDSKYPSFSLPFSSSTLTASAFHSLKLKKQIYGAADQLGSFRLFFVPEDTAPGSTESKCEKFKYFILRELDRKKKFVSWQKVWNEKNEELLLERGTEEQDLHEKELEEKRAKLAESLDKKSAADAIDAAEANKKGPQPGKYVEWIIAQRQAQEEARIKATIISKKQLDTKELEKRRKPLQKLDEENERKKRKQKQRLKEGESIFMNTVTSLFPDIMKEKPLPPPDPYSSLELDSTSLQETYVGFRELKEHAEKFITSHPYNYVFYWKKVIANGRRRREKLANIKKDTRKASTRSTIASSMAIDFMEEFDEKDENESNEKEEKEVTE